MDIVPSKQPRILKLLYILFFISGFSALLYQIIWQRALFSVYGIDIQSTTTVVASFLLGLGIGALIGGHLSTTRFINLLKLFGLLEVVTGIIGWFSLHAISTASNYTLMMPPHLIKLFVCILLLPPTITMGASLPVLVAYFARREPNIAHSVGLLYAINTLGSAVACFYAAYILIRFFGQAGTIKVAAILNIFVGIAGLFIAFFSRVDRKGESANQNSIPVFNIKNSTCEISTRILLLLSVLTGYVSLSYEIIWFHAYAFLSGSKFLDFSLVLGNYLFGVAFGSWICAKYFYDSYNQNKVFDARFLFVMLLSTSISSFLVLPAMSMINVNTSSTVLPLLPVIIASSCFGINFPLISYYLISPNARAGSMMGIFYFSNIFGGVISALLTGFIFVNFFSIQIISALLLAISLIGPIIVLWILKHYKSFFSISLFIVMVMGAITFPTANLLLHDFYAKLFKNSKIVLKYIVENNAGVILVDQNNTVFGGGVYDGKFNLSIEQDCNGIWRAYAISLFTKNPTNVLMIGLSSGSWAKVVADNPKVKNLTIIEINPGYLELIKQYPTHIDLLANPKVHIIIDDGRRWLLRNNEKFDLIVMNTTFHWRNYASLLLSKDFMEIVQQHLTDHGIFYFNTTGSIDAVKTALLAFSDIKRLANFVIASNKPLILDIDRYKKTLAQCTKDKKLIKKIVTMTFGKITNKDQLEKLAYKAQIITDDNMLTEWK